MGKREEGLKRTDQKGIDEVIFPEEKGWDFFVI